MDMPQGANTKSGLPGRSIGPCGGPKCHSDIYRVFTPYSVDSSDLRSSSRNDLPGRIKAHRPMRKYIHYGRPAIGLRLQGFHSIR